MFKLWKRNKDKGSLNGGAKTKKKRKIALCACAAALLACVTGASVMLGLNSHNDGIGGNGFINTGIGGNGANSATGNISTTANDWKYKVALKATAEKSLEDLWNEVCSYNDGTVYAVLEQDWVAPATAAGFGSGPNFDTGAINVAAGKNIIIDLNGYKIDRNLSNVSALSGGVCLAVEPSGTLEVIDSSSAQTGKVTGGNIDGSGGGVWLEGKFILSGGSITENKAGDASTDYIGAGVMVYGGEFIMNGGEISNNKITNCKNYALGGGICVIKGGSFTMNGGLISENENSSSKYSGGLAVYTEQSGSKCTINGGLITRHGLNDNAGTVVDTEADAYFTMNGGEISDNKADTGTIHLSSAAGEINGGKICNNRIRSAAEGNTEKYGGPAAYIYNSLLTMNGGEISGNTTTIGPSAVSLDPTSSFTMTGGLITDNTTTDTAKVIPYTVAGTSGGSKTVPFGAVAQWKDASVGAEIELSGGKIIGNHGGGVRPTMNWSGTNLTSVKNSMTKLYVSGPVIITDNDDYNVYLAYRYVGGTGANNYCGLVVKLKGNPVVNGRAPNIGLYYDCTGGFQLVSVTDKNYNWTSTADYEGWGQEFGKYFFADRTGTSITMINDSVTKCVFVNG